MDTKKEGTTVTNTTHTPGPWAWLSEEAVRVVDETGGVVATLGHLTRRHTGPRRAPSEVLSNARLIAAAPELLEALPEMVNMARAYLAMCPDRRGHDVAAIERAEAAIAKAEGRTNG